MQNKIFFIQKSAKKQSVVKLQKLENFEEAPLNSRPVNLHPLFLFWKPGSVFDSEKTRHPDYFKKQGAKNQGHCYSKREEAAWSLLFLNNNDPVFLKKKRVQKPRSLLFKKRRGSLVSFWITMALFFCTPLFAKSRVPDFLKVPDPKKYQVDLMI